MGSGAHYGFKLCVFSLKINFLCLAEDIKGPISWEWKDDSLRQRSTRGTLQRQSTEHFISSSEREPPPEGRDSNEGPRPSTENQGLKTPVSGEESPQHYEAIPLDEIAVAY